MGGINRPAILVRIQQEKGKSDTGAVSLETFLEKQARVVISYYAAQPVCVFVASQISLIPRILAAWHLTPVHPFLRFYLLSMHLSPASSDIIHVSPYFGFDEVQLGCYCFGLGDNETAWLSGWK